MAASPDPMCHYFVDEAGDSSLFDRKGQIIIGQSGCSHYFMLGLVEVAEPDALARDLEALRTSLLADPYFKQVPSMQPEARKTALAFHAKDDVPEVRHQVFTKCGVKPRNLFLGISAAAPRRWRDLPCQRYLEEPNDA